MSFSDFSYAGEYNEFRQHELRKRRLNMVDGNLTANDSSHVGGQSARVYQNGYWGFASATQPAGADKLGNLALANASALQVFGGESRPLPQQAYQGEHGIACQPNWSSEQLIEWLQEVTALTQNRYEKVVSVTAVALDEYHDKFVQNSLGARAYNNISRALVYLLLTVKDKDDKPVELSHIISGKGSFGNLDLAMASVEPQLDGLYEHLLAKREAVHADGGLQNVVLAPNLAGMLAHEAMGHPCEADLVLGGAVTGDKRGQRIASDLITMVDFAHSYNGEELAVPVYADDEGTPAQDVTLIKQGVLTDFMHNRETASRFDNSATGNARAYSPDDEPLIRMRNTAILPGTSNLDDMIADVEDGYYLMKTGNGQADTTTEFMFGINLGYEIKDGKLGRAIKDTTLSGSAIKMLQTVDAVSDDMHWESAGYCGKKQPMVVSMGGPAIRAKAQLGGE
ncbi:TldD/PmbA family protein [Gilvimarinus sp. SDUM040013]|uniref:TldD/PmbA family protein n=1 Tax=Gilvimarinus gilvus TaxID=3058038 RepID=A0ABU4S2D3_9GAMM|nr:TldD/PmbA family protein [Gilvimarinus sp. SDUM040013]MDO3386898.1 TldD/PmbA family protein [Gilvimarinus sp. SDUM040013]MDX6851335.1 TldD/PmbA family protein [Gilvimarinus sp. SDUM040013]